MFDGDLVISSGWLNLLMGCCEFWLLMLLGYLLFCVGLSVLLIGLKVLLVVSGSVCWFVVVFDKCCVVFCVVVSCLCVLWVLSSVLMVCVCVVVESSRFLLVWIMV